MKRALRRIAVSCLLTATLAAPACAARQGGSARPSDARAAADTAPVRQLQSDLALVFGAPLMSRGVWAVDVRSLDTGQSLYALNADRLMLPASNMKILTLAAAAEALGWDHRFTTTLETTATIAGGVLQGDLIVRGTGDPTIGARENRAAAVLDEWAAALKAAGITAIDGRIVGNDQAFDDEGVGPGWSWDYLQYGYAAPVGALQFNENVASLAVLPSAQEGQPAMVSLTAGSGFIVLNRATTSAAGTPETVDYKRYLDRPLLEVTGTVPLPAESPARTVSRSVAVVNPTVFFAQQLKDGLEARGIRVQGAAEDIDDVAASLLPVPSPGLTPDTPGVRVLAIAQSPTLREIGTVLMKVSQNLYAETLLKAIGASRGGLGTWNSGRGAARSVLESWGLPPDSFVISDGSGLSRYNYVTARTLTTLLEHLHKDPKHRDAFAATLPIAGKDGTIATRMRRSRAEGNAIAKTGSIANVRSLSGFVRTRDGEMLVFSVLANDFVIPAATVNWTADLGIEILSNFSRR